MQLWKGRDSSDPILGLGQVVERGGHVLCKTGSKERLEGAKVVLLQGRDQARRETAAERQGTHKDLARRSRPTSDHPRATGEARTKLRWGLGMTPGQSCTRTPALFGRSWHTLKSTSRAQAVRPWRQSAFGLTRWALLTGGRANPAASRPRRSVWQHLIGRSERASPDQISGAPVDRWDGMPRSRKKAFVIGEHFLLGLNRTYS